MAEFSVDIVGLNGLYNQLRHFGDDADEALRVVQKEADLLKGRGMDGYQPRTGHLEQALLRAVETQSPRGSVLGEIAGALRRGELTPQQLAASQVYGDELLEASDEAHRHRVSLTPEELAEYDRQATQLRDAPDDLFGPPRP